VNKHPNWLCASVFASAMAALATIPAIAQSPAGTGEAQAVRAVHPALCLRNNVIPSFRAKCGRAFESMLFAKAARHSHTLIKWSWARSFHHPV
jgi:hypothetical protein